MVQEIEFSGLAKHVVDVLFLCCLQLHQNFVVKTVFSR